MFLTKGGGVVVAGIGVGVGASEDEGEGEGNGPEFVPMTTICAPDTDARMF